MKLWRRKWFAFFVIFVILLLLCVITYKKVKSELNTLTDSQEYKATLQDIQRTTIVNSWHSRTTSEKHSESIQTKAVPLTSIIPSRGIYETILFNNSLSILNTIYISVKTSTKFHNDRLAPLLVTWMQPLNPDQVNIITDKIDSDKKEDKWLKLARQMGITVHHVNCPIGHDSASLCCKSGEDFDHYYRTIEEGRHYKWFCHFDDDVYVNIPRLVSMFQKYNPTEEFRYIGKFPFPPDRMFEFRRTIPKSLRKKWKTFRYAGGPVYCLSSKLMKEVEQYLRGKAFSKSCKKYKIQPEDITVGAIVQIVLKHSFTEEEGFHFQHLMKIPLNEYKNQITVNLDGYDDPNATFTKEVDPSRYLSFHCSLYPSVKWCNVNIHSIDDVTDIMFKPAVSTFK